MSEDKIVGMHVPPEVVEKMGPVGKLTVDLMTMLDDFVRSHQNQGIQVWEIVNAVTSVHLTTCRNFGLPAENYAAVCKTMAEGYANTKEILSEVETAGEA